LTISPSGLLPGLSALLAVMVAKTADGMTDYPGPLAGRAKAARPRNSTRPAPGGLAARPGRPGSDDGLQGLCGSGWPPKLCGRTRHLRHDRGSPCTLTPSLSGAGPPATTVATANITTGTPRRAPRLLLRRPERAEAAALTAAGLMTSPAVTVTAEATAATAAQIMLGGESEAAAGGERHGSAGWNRQQG
jgi:hypothetical protein